MGRDVNLDEAPPMAPAARQVKLCGRQLTAVEAAMSGRNVFITGPGGTGKSEVLREVVRRLRDDGKRVAVTASTGIAAVAVGGMTIHSTMGLGIASTRAEAMAKIGPETIQKAQERLYHVDTIVVEEVSMLMGDYLDMTNWWLNRVAEKEGPLVPFGGYQMVFVGDFLQLPPVVKNTDRQPVARYGFESEAWKKADIEEVYLNESHRQADPDLFRHLCLIRRGIVSEETVEYFRPCVGRQVEDPTNLYGTNHDAFDENMRRLRALPGEEKVFRARIEGHPKWQRAVVDSCIAEEELSLKVGAPVIFLKNNYSAGYVNGQRGTVEEMTPDGIMVSTEGGGNVLVEHATWEMRDPSDRLLAAMKQYPLKLAWAITCHKSQGMSLDRVHVDLSGCFERGQAYVALSRARTMEGLSLSVLPGPGNVRASNKIVEYYKELARKMKAREMKVTA